MASLPSASIHATLRLEAESRKQPLPPTDKNQILFPRCEASTQFDGSSEPTRPPDFKEALSMIKESTKIESSCYVPLLQECIDKNSLLNAEIVHAHLIKSGIHQDSFISTFLVNVYGKCGSMENARKVFGFLPRPNVVAWTTLVTGYVQNSQPEVAIRVFHKLLEGGCYPTNYTLGAALNAASLLNSLELGKQIHGYVIKYRIQGDTSVGNSLCSLYSNCGSLDSAVEVFEKIQDKNVVSWTAIISACGENGKPLEGLRIFLDMLYEGIAPNECTLAVALSLCCTVSYLDVGSQVHSVSFKRGYDSNLRIKNSAMYLYLKCGWIREAEILFNGIGSASLVTWNSLIAGHARIMKTTIDDLSAHRNGTEALKIFLKLNRSGLKPDLYTFSSTLTVCSRMVALEQGEQLHAQTLKTGFLSEVVVGTALVSMYNRCGTIERASKAFSDMSMRTLISWTSMITGFANHGQPETALQLFSDMRMARIEPNQITFAGVLTACSRAGMVKEALEYLEMMQNVYRIKPLMDHYGCIIEMFARLGQLDEAFEFVRTTNLQPNEYIWSAILTGCRAQGNIELGLYAAEQLLRLGPKDPETYDLLLNTYISADKPDEVSKVRELIKNENMRRIEDWSWITIKDKVHSFRPDDQMHPCSEEIYAFLDELLNEAKTHGYEPKGGKLETADAEDEKKCFSLVHHGEKLALGLGLLSAPEASLILIVKSLSMCSDCHTFMKMVSFLTGRTIVVRDSNRLHRFIDGQCSCGEFFGIHS